MAVATFVAVSVLALKYEQKIYEQDKKLSEFLDIFSSFVDAKDSYMYGYSDALQSIPAKLPGNLVFRRKNAAMFIRLRFCMI